MTHRILIVTLPPTTGGVPAKTKILCDFLRRLGHEVTLAYYATISDHPDLVAPSWRLPSGARPGTKTGTCFVDQPCVAIGCWLPELEFTYYRSRQPWRDLIASHDRHIATGGTVLVSNFLHDAGVPHMAWCASTMIDDRIDRRNAMPAMRRLFDKAVIGPVQARMEADILRGNGRFMAVSRYTAQTLNDKGADPAHMRVVPVPVDTAVFTPSATPPQVARIGFAGRPEDPRKNLPLLVRAIAELNARGIDATLALTGAPHKGLLSLAHDLKIAERIGFTGWIDEDALPDFYRSLDVFVFASGKEGLGISGLQAMASGVPVVSTRCGGPEDYVLPGKTGLLVDTSVSALADALAEIVTNRELRNDLGKNARTLMTETFSPAAFESTIADVWNDTWGEPLSPAN